MTATRTFQSRQPVRSAFTLTELLVAVALLVVVMLAVSTIFRTTSQTISTGQAVGDLTRRLSTAKAAMYSDLAGHDSNPLATGTGMLPMTGAPGAVRAPFLYINNVQQYAFRDRASWLAEGSPVAAPADAAHTFRADSLGFVAIGGFKRQTGGGPDTSSMATVQNTMLDRPDTQSSMIQDMAYIWYGHLWLPNNAGAFTPFTWPGQGNQTTNPNNFFASQWTLGRVSLLMVQPVTDAIWTLGHAVLDRNYYPTFYYGRDPLTLLPNPVTNPGNGLQPLQWNSTVTGGWTAYASFDDSALPLGRPNYGATLVQSRYDIVGTNSAFTWANYTNMVGAMTYPAPPTANPNYYANWAFDFLRYRFTANPAADLPNPNTVALQHTFARELAQAVPIFLPNCAKFTVEFAGDFIAQNANGTVNGASVYSNAFGDRDYDHPQVDGQIDFNIWHAGQPDETRTIRWYGLPRKADGSDISVSNPLIFPDDPANPAPNRGYADVLPVSCSRRVPGAPTFPALPVSKLPFEHNITTTEYTCAWSRSEADLDNLPAHAVTAPYVIPDLPVGVPRTLAPKLIRITIQLLDQDGRVEDGMTQQYVFPVKFN